MSESTDTMWLAYSHNGQILKLLFDGFEFGCDPKTWKEHPRFEEFRGLMKELALEVWEDLKND